MVVVKEAAEKAARSIACEQMRGLLIWLVLLEAMLRLCPSNALFCVPPALATCGAALRMTATSALPLVGSLASVGAAAGKPTATLPGDMQDISPQPGRTFFIETHGCQMNLADSDVVRSVLLTAGYAPTDSLEAADLIMTNTCAVRDNAEAKVYHRLRYFNSLRRKRQRAGARGGFPLVGLLGCMAARLKTRLLEDPSLGISFVAGPDAYRELPSLLAAASTDQRAASVALSLEETYADIAPVREAEGGLHAFVTITRGCNNLCSFCIVPFTRGRERSRAADSVVSEVCRLREGGYREVVLLGQNVNSYHDTSLLPGNGDGDGNTEGGGGYEGQEGKERDKGNIEPGPYALAPGFSQKCKDPVVHGGRGGVRFGELLQRVAEVDPEMRVRFQAPHPKDFPDDVLSLIRDTPNICRALHMPAQHGASSCLQRMQVKNIYCWRLLLSHTTPLYVLLIIICPLSLSLSPSPCPSRPSAATRERPTRH